MELNDQKKTKTLDFLIIKGKHSDLSQRILKIKSENKLTKKKMKNHRQPQPSNFEHFSKKKQLLDYSENLFKEFEKIKSKPNFRFLGVCC